MNSSAPQAHKKKFNKEVYVKHEKAPTAPRFEGVSTISYMPMFLKIKHFWATLALFRWPKLSKLEKAHLQAKTFHMSLFMGLYDHS